MFSNDEIAEYYDTTQVHYERWWGLNKHQSLHYGVWDSDTKNFGQALENTNKYLLEAAKIQNTDNVLDAGCGVGGAAFYIHKTSGAKVTGISLSQNQVNQANATASTSGIENSVHFDRQDFTNTQFPDESFDVIWACESVCHAAEKKDFLKECYRLLKKGGRVVILDFFLTSAGLEDKSGWINKWKQTWAVPSFEGLEIFKTKAKEVNFNKVETKDLTPKIQKSAKRMLKGAYLALFFSEAYAILNPKVSRFAKHHYKCGYYQYKALKDNLWKYQLIKLTK